MTKAYHQKNVILWVGLIYFESVCTTVNVWKKFVNIWFLIRCTGIYLSQDYYGELSDGDGQLAASFRSSQGAVSSGMGTSNLGNTFNINTIIPPTSNSDGTMSKATSLSLQVPQSTSIIHGQFLPSQLWVSLCWYHCQDRFSILIMKIGLVIFIFPCSGQCGFICQMWHIWSCFDVWQYHIKCFYYRITVCKALHECLVPYMTCMHTAAKEAKYEYLIYPLHSNEYWVPDKIQQPWGTRACM